MAIIGKRIQKILRTETRRIRVLPPAPKASRRCAFPPSRRGAVKVGMPMIKTHPLRDVIPMPYLQKSIRYRMSYGFPKTNIHSHSPPPGGGKIRAGLPWAQGGERESKRFLRVISYESDKYWTKKDCFI